MLAGPEVLLGRSLPELQRFAQERGQPAYRGKQLYDGLLHGAHSVLEFSNVMPHPHQHAAPLISRQQSSVHVLPMHASGRKKADPTFCH